MHFQKKNITDLTKNTLSNYLGFPSWSGSRFWCVKPHQFLVACVLLFRGHLLYLSGQASFPPWLITEQLFSHYLPPQVSMHYIWSSLKRHFLLVARGKMLTIMSSLTLPFQLYSSGKDKVTDGARCLSSPQALLQKQWTGTLSSLESKHLLKIILFFPVLSW